MNKTHIQHTVCLIEGEDFDVGEVKVFLVHKVQQTAGSGHNNINSTLQGLDLRALTDTTEDDSMREVTKVLAVCVNTLSNLGCKLTSRGNDKSSDDTFRTLSILRLKVLKKGKGKGSGLTCSGLSSSKDISTLKYMGDGLLLDGGWTCVPRVRYSTEELRNEAKLCKLLAQLSSIG